ncbi:conserved hypothetical protein [Clostridiaceae bacterium BL-3]|nr:conserved hypothetical protein [Clostridiaceae bacterium BL-3]
MNDIHRDHFHGIFYGRFKETPAVFSYSNSFEFKNEFTGDEIRDSILEFMNNVKKWVQKNKYFIGHLKVFAKSENNFNIWIATTGKKINVKELSGQDESNIKHIDLNITLIVFGTDEESLKSEALKNLNKSLSIDSEERNV